MITASLRPKIATYSFPQEKADRSFQFTINDIRDGSSYYKSPPHPHAHAYFEIFLIEKGGGTHLVDQEIYDFTDNSVHILQPGITHLVRRDEHTSGSVIVFSLDVIAGENNTITNSLLCFFRNPLMQPCSAVSRRAFQELMSIVGLMKSTAALHVNSQERNACIGSLFTAFLLTLKPNFTTGYQSNNGDALSLVGRFNDLVNEHYHEGLSIADYAFKLGVGEKTLSRTIKKHSLTTPARIIRERAIIEACRLLRSTDHSVKEIAYHLHFSDPAHFVKVFRQMRSCTPVEYRNSGPNS
jgi:AraC family transcriptional activator of pobA